MNPAESKPAGSLTESPAGRGIAAAAFLIMVGNLMSRVLGLVREQLASGLFGTGDQIAAFQIADNVQTLLFDLVISGMLQAALVPVLIQWAAPTSRSELRRVSGALLTLTLVVVGSAVGLGMIFAPAVVDLMTAAGGSSRSAETRELTIELVRIILPAVLFLSVGTLFMGVLYALNRVAAPALSLAVRNLVVVIAIAAFSGLWGVHSMAAGVVGGAICIALMNGYALHREGALPRPALSIRHPGVGQVLRLYGPIFAGLIVSAAAIVLDRNLAWRAEEDALGAMRYATTLVQFVLGLVAAAISLAALPTLSTHFTRGNEAAFQRTLERALIMVTVLILPATFGLAATAVPAVRLLFQHGETDADGARLIVIALIGYLPGTLFAAYDQILIYAFYARRNTWLPVVVGIAASVVFLVAAWVLGRAFGMIGLVIANSIQFIVHALVMAYLIRPVLRGARYDELRSTMRRCFVAALAMAGVAFGVWIAVDAVLPLSGGTVSRLGGQTLALLAPVGVGSVVYWFLLKRFNVPAVVEIQALVVSRLPLPGRS